MVRDVTSAQLSNLKDVALKSNTDYHKMDRERITTNPDEKVIKHLYKFYKVKDIWYRIPSYNMLLGVLPTDKKYTQKEVVTKWSKSKGCYINSRRTVILPYTENWESADVSNSCLVYKCGDQRAKNLELDSICCLYKNIPFVINIPFTLLFPEKPDGKLWHENKPLVFTRKDKFNLLRKIHPDINHLDDTELGNFLTDFKEGIISITEMEKEYKCPRRVFFDLVCEWYLLSNKKEKYMTDKSIQQRNLYTSPRNTSIFS